MLTRKLEPEVMDCEVDAREYDAMDHSDVNRVFVSDFLEFARGNWQKFGGIGEAKSQDDDEETDSNFSLGDVLDAGTGTALIPIELCKRHRHCRMMAIDMAASMLNLAVYRVEAAGLRSRIQLARVDAKQMIFPDQMFDAVISNSILHHLADPILAINEMIRVTRHGGLIFVRDLMRPDSEETLQELVAMYTGLESEMAQRLFRDSLRAALTLEEIRELIASTGISANTVSASSDRHWTWSARKDV